MKKIYLTLSLLMLSLFSYSQLIITEIADPNDNAAARYVEIYNVSGSSVDLTDWEIRRWTNANAGPQATGVNLTSIGILDPGEFVLIAANATEFQNAYGFAPHIEAGTGGAADSNGDDQIAIFDASDNTIDIFGVPGEDGTGTCHEFEDGRAERIATVTASNSVWDESEWNVWADSQVTGCTSHTQLPVNAGDGIYDPGFWIGSAGNTNPSVTVSPSILTGFVQFVGTPSAEQTFDVSGTNLPGDLDLTSTGDYEISLTSGTGFGASLTVQSSNGDVAPTPVYVRLNGVAILGQANGLIAVVIIGAVTGDTVDLEGQILDPNPVIFVSEDTLTGFSHFVGTPSDAQTFEVSGNYLTDEAVLMCLPECQIATSPAGPFSNSITLPSGVTPVNHIVETLGTTFSPNSLNIVAGDTVTFINTGGTHNVNGTTATFPSNPESFGIAVSSGWTFQHVFQTPGTYDYQCDPHAGMGMTGSITVSPSPPGEILSTPIYVRLNGAAQNYNQTGIITVSTVGIADQYVYIFGETLDYLPYPIGVVTTNDTSGVADSLGVYVMLEGLVHCIDFDGNEGYSFTIIDNNMHGINVFNFADVSNYVVNEGDMIRVYGQIDQFNGLTEIFADSIDIAVQNMPITNPVVVTALDESTESQWITLENLSFVTPITTFPTGSNNLDVTDGTNVYTLRIDSDTDIPGSNTPAEPFDVTGVGGQYDSSSPYDSGYQLFPCGTGSFVPNSTTSLQPSLLEDLVRVYPNPVGDNLHIDIVGIDELDVEILDAQGRLIQLLKLNDSIDIGTSSWGEGIYFVHLQDSEGNTFVQKLIK